MGVTGKEYAAHRGVHPSRVSQWKSRDRLVLGADGKIDVEASDAKLSASLDQAKGARSSGSNITSAAPAASGQPGTPPDAPAVVASPAQPADQGAGDRVGVKSPTYWDSRSRREKAEAELAELRALEAAGALTSVAGVKKEAAETARALRNAILAIPDRIAPVLDPGNPARAHKLLTDELQKVLREFSSELEQRAAAAAGADQRELALQ